ncbi:MAG: hypothetical protein Q7J16_06145 [Candidatus Cloacimonadales bacterium]|nr:hypothetical protein [Candidatus Cloacimonadales bacterium]
MKKLTLLPILIFLLVISGSLYAQKSNNFLNKPEKIIDITLRTGQGGFKDHRSDIDKLGGGQLAFDVKLTKYPIALSISVEYYTNSADPTHPYEISDMTAINLLYMKKPFKTDRINLFAGGGFGWLEVPKGIENSDATEKGNLFDLECGINVRAFWKIGFYGIYKYLYASKEKNNVKVIDFNEHIILIGISLNLSF